MKRKAVSKTLRFEVFKRDGFRCQYCGRSAPDVVLHVDHVKPRSKGGDNDILNLVTSCLDCNLGKSDRPLDDNAALNKQRDQLAELNERREQLEMMIRWKEELSKLGDHVLDRLAEHWSKLLPGYSLNENGRQSIKRLCRKFEAEEILEAMDIAAEQYLRFDGDQLDPESANLAWSKVAGICRVRKEQKSKPYLRDLFYIRGILRNRVCVNENRVMPLLKEAAEAGADIESLKGLAKTSGSWTEFREEVEDFVASRARQARRANGPAQDQAD